jgi:hypothetical protein
MFHLFSLAEWMNGISEEEDTDKENAMGLARLEKVHGIGKSISRCHF